MPIAIRTLLMLCLLFSLSISIAYGNKEDSLKTAIAQTKDNCVKIKLLRQLSYFYVINKNSDKAIIPASEALNLARWEKDNKNIIYAHGMLGYAYQYSFNFSKALENYFLALRYLKATADYTETARIYISISNTYNQIKMPQATIEACKKGIAILKEHPNDIILEQCYLSLGKAYGNLNDYEKEIWCYRKRLEILKSMKESPSLGLGFNSLGYAFWALHKYDSALKYFNIYFEISKQVKDSIGIKRALSNIGSTLYSQGDYKKAITFYQRALKYNQRMVISHTYFEMVHAYCKLNNLPKATYYFDLAQSVDEGEDFNEPVKACDSLALTYRKNNHKDKAIAYMALSNKLHQKIFDKSQSTVERTAKTKYDVEGMEARILEEEANTLLKENLKLNVRENRFLIIILALIVVIGVFLVYLYRKRLRDKEQKLSEAAKEKLLLIKELSFLKNQFNSHITFNFLNFCYGNVFQLSSQTGEAIALFSDMLWYSLKTNIEEKVSVRKEVEHIENFLKLQKLLTTRLFVNFRHNPIPETKLIHPRILITFIENAFKHGKTNDEHAPIDIELATDERSIRLSVKNKKGNKGPNAARDTGIGHENVDQILKIFYPDKYKIHTEDCGELYSCSLVLND